jgi:hypothetical protein
LKDILHEEDGLLLVELAVLEGGVDDGAKD